MKNIFYVLLVSMFTLGSTSIHAHCGDAEMHADKTKKEKKEKEKKEKQQSDFDWQEFSGNFMSQVTSLLTVVVLATQLP